MKATRITGVPVFASVKETSMKVVRAAAVQMSPVLYSREATVEKLVRKIHALGQQGCS